jgi:hypothetical protein
MLFYTWEHAATLLADGRVLVVGGLDFADPNLTPSETYDPGSQRWTRQGNLIKTRNAELTATPLPDGRVLVVGGDIYEGYQTSEVFDPASGAWTLTANLNIPRSHARTAALSDGRVLLAGGVRVGDGVNPARDVEIYDPASGSWMVTGSLVVSRSGTSFGLITLQDGRVLLVGSDGLNASWELYDPSLGVWTLGGSMNSRLWFQPLTLLPDGRVLSVNLFVRNAFFYSPASNTWTQSTGPQFRHDWGSATLLQDGTVLATAAAASTTCCAEVFDSVWSENWI